MTDHDAQIRSAASRWFGKAVEALDESEARALHHAKRRKVVSRHPNETFDETMSFGDRLADRVAEFGGSWTFIVLFVTWLAVWVVGNVWLLGSPFDPYPFIFLNLLLSMIAALQAPVIMMSQNRQSAKDRQNAALDYEVNLKSEIEIMALHEKLDALRNEHIVALIEKQKEQILLLTRLIEQRGDAAT